MIVFLTSFTIFSGSEILAIYAGTVLIAL